MRLRFLGAAQTVTGSRYLVSARGSRVLVDCGLYQGSKDLRLRNWQPFPVPVDEIDAVVLTHAHIDHSGFLPALYRQGYRGPIYCTSGTRALCRVLLPDAGFLQEEDAHYANRKNLTRQAPAEPLFTRRDADEVLHQFREITCNKAHQVARGIEATLRPSGHILGASSVLLDDGAQTILFSGDLGRYDDPVMFPPEPPLRADYLVVESTYGDRCHPSVDAEQVLGEIIDRTTRRGGTVLVPAFAVGRAQLVLYLLQRLRARGAIPQVPIYLNSPMAIRATEIFCRFSGEHRLSSADCERIDAGTTYVRTVEESQALTRQKYPCVIISASGMASGGRVLHHLKTLITDHRNSVVFAGFQAPGTRGAALVAGAGEIRIHGVWLPVRAEVHNLDALSAHADADEILRWLGSCPEAPRRVFVTHGEPAAAAALQLRIGEQLGWQAAVPGYDEEAQLG